MATMPSSGVALAWMIISPFAFLTDCLAVIFICHYKPLYHSCDVAFISLFVTMATNTWLLLPIPAVVKLAGFYWSQSLCAFYTWLSVTLRSSHILVLLVLNVYWMASLRVSRKNNLFTSTKPITASVFICWFISLVIGLIPAADVAHVFGYYEDNVCKFLPSNISRGFAIFFIIVPLVSTVMGVVSSLDSLLLFKAMKDVALTKYSADRFHLPTISGGLSASARIHAKYNELNVTIELCRLVLLFSMASSVLNAIPLLASQFVQLIQDYSRESLEATLLWLLLMEALLLPHLLWLLSRRYRHAVAYTWRVFVLRDTSAREEDTASCSLQAFRTNVKDVTSRPYRNGGVNTRQANGTVSGPGIEDNHEETNRNGNYNAPQSRSNGFLHASPSSGHCNGVMEYSLVSSLNTTGMASGSASELTPVKRITLPEVVILHETSRQGMTHAQKKGQGYSEVRETSLSSGQISVRDNRTSRGSVAVLHDADDEENFSQLNSPINRPTNTSTSGHVKRSISGSSRMEWKERMMKKHLPTVFLGSSVEDETDTDPTSTSMDRPEEATSQANTAPRERHENSSTSRRRDTVSRSHENWTSTESTYYLSGDYHYDYLNDTLAQFRPHSSVDSGESAGKYAEEDIRTILDNSLTSESHVNTVSNCDSDNYMLRSRNVSQLESDTELLKNVTRPGQNTKNIPLTSTEIQERESKNPNSHHKYAKDVHTLSANFDAPNNDTLLKGSSQSTLGDRTASGGRSLTESVSQPTATIVSVHSGQPAVLRSNYRKFLPYTDLIISDVDDATADENIEQEERSKQAEVTFPIVKSEHTAEHFNHLHREPTAVKEMKASSLSENQNNLQTAVTGRTFTTEKLATREKDEDYVQDYSKCETVSGSEMLRLKMKSIRAAAAMYPSDDNTSDDGGIDNNGFTETSNDDSDDNNDQYDEKQSTAWFNNSNINIAKGIGVGGINSGRENSKQYMSTLQADDVDDDDDLAGVTLERDGAGDGEESDLDAHGNGKAVATTIPIIKQSDDNKNEASVRSSYDQLVKSSNVFKPTASDHFKITANLRSAEPVNTSLQGVGYRRHGPSEDYSYADLTDSAPSTEYTANLSTQNDVNTTKLHVPSDKQSTYGIKQQGSKAKPPRHRKQPDASPFLLSDSATDSIRSTSLDIEDNVIQATKGSSYSEAANGAVPIEEDTAIESDISEVTDTDSNGSDLSVTLEPYGYRRPDWMNDVLLSSSSSEQTGFKKARELSNLEEESTDFILPNYSTVSRHADDASLKARSNHSNSIGVSYNNYQPAALPSHQPLPVLVPYHFNDDTDDDYGDSIMIDYSSQSNVYRHKNLYFEAIKEEPEDLISDSASSFDQSDTSVSNGLRDTPSKRSGQIDSNIAVQPNSNKPAQFLHSLPKISRSSNTFPTSERTSADGSEAIPTTNASNCLSSSQTSINTLMKTNSKPKPDPLQQRITLKDLAKQTAKKDANSVVLSEEYTDMQNFHTPGAAIKDNVQADRASSQFNVNKRDSVTIADCRSGNGPYDHETTNSGFLGFHKGVEFPGPMEAEPIRREAAGTTPVYF